MDVEIKLINEHQGHSQGNIDLDRYGKNYDVEILLRTVLRKLSMRVQGGGRFISLE